MLGFPGYILSPSLADFNITLLTAARFHILLCGLLTDLYGLLTGLLSFLWGGWFKKGAGKE